MNSCAPSIVTVSIAIFSMNKVTQWQILLDFSLLWSKPVLQCSRTS
uniref:Uncharacterized protein n=1 Tax=Anguilla anguilla TaxID=7936 RepID=A0A0E9U9I5_ANGAN